jgi:hypothetical protein
MILLTQLPGGKFEESLAGAEGFEPPKAVLETAGLPLAYAPIWYPPLIIEQNCQKQIGATAQTQAAAPMDTTTTEKT